MQCNKRYKKKYQTTKNNSQLKRTNQKGEKKKIPNLYEFYTITAEFKRNPYTMCPRMRRKQSQIEAPKGTKLE